DHVVLAIVISNDLKYTDEGIKSEALTVADKIRKLIPNVSICIAAQPDNREKTLDLIVSWLTDQSRME
uniref:AAA family ATPase n=1 Tax=Loa loa TaxID=7209 RepID=A0A1I7VE21_LOALO